VSDGSLDQSNRTECAVSECDREISKMRTMPTVGYGGGGGSAVAPCKRKILVRFLCYCDVVVYAVCSATSGNINCVRCLLIIVRPFSFAEKLNC